MIPLVSVLMPVRNEEDFIAKSLQAVLNQDYPAGKMEILIADGRSQDKTRDIIEGLMKRHSFIKLIDNPRGIVSSGLNACLLVSRGEIIVRVDGHCEIAPDYVRCCVELLEKEEAGAVGGPIETVGETLTAQAIALAMSSFFGVGGSAFRTLKNEKKYVDTAAFFAVRRETLEKAGPFDEELVRNQDDEYNYRLRKLGFRILLDPAIRSRYYSRAGLVSLAKQYFQYGFWKVRVMQKHPCQMQWRQFIPPAFVFSLLAAFAFSLFEEMGKMIWIGITASYLSVNLLASLAVSFQNGWQYLFLLPLVFAALHFSYGFGFLTGLIKFWDRWDQAAR